MEVLSSLLSEPDLSIALKSSWRAAFHEAYAVVTAELKQQVERSEEVQVRTLTQPERAERYEKQVKRLSGVNIKGSSEPSERLVDVCVAIYERNQLQYVPWSRCSSREQEAQNESRKEVKLALDSSGKVKVDSASKEVVADTSTEVLVMQALQRRALAMEQANIVSYTLLDLWHQRLMKARLTDPPPGYSRPSFDQLRLADQKLFSELQDETRSGIQALSSGRPVDNLIKDVMHRAEVSSLLLPLPAPSVASIAKSTATAPPPQPTWKGNGKGKGKLKGKTGVGPWLKPMKALRGEAVCDDALSGRVDDLLALFEMLPFEDCPRSDDSGARAFGGGAYMKGLLPHRILSPDNHTLGVVADALASLGFNLDINPITPLDSLFRPVLRQACCGCARLSATLKKDGFDVLPLDCEGNRHRPLVTVVTPDLRKPASWEFLQTCVLTNRVFHFHGAPPCGTASRARDRPMSSAEWGPPPLRSDRYPQGFPWLRGTWRDKVESANLIYLQMARFCEWLSSLNISWSVENPERSYMWLLPEWKHLRSQCLDVVFDSCMWGSCRKKSTRFLTTCVEMLSLAKTCDNKHSHAGWQPVRNKSGVQYATAQEAAYPHELCQAMSSALQLQAASFNLELVRECPLELSSHAAAASARRQPKLSKYKPLLEDFKYRVTVAVDSVEHLILEIVASLLARRGPAIFRLMKIAFMSRVLRGRVHPYWLQHPERARVLVKTVDLKSAYKQLALHPDDRRFSVISLKDPADDEPKGFLCRVLPFGSIASVGHFNRVARLVQRIFHEMKLLAANYFDDYPLLEVAELSQNADRCAKAVLDLFGFTWAKDKDEAFSPCTDLLGIRLATSTSGPAAVTLSNKPSRVADLRSAIDKVVSDGVLKPREAASVFGRLQFAETQLLGRAGRLAMADIRWIERAHHDVKLDDLDKDVFRMLASRVASGKPRVLTASTSAARALVFTDGACEGDEGNQQLTIGGVLYFWTGKVWLTRWFSGFVPAELATAWRAARKRHLIGPTELYAVIVARHVWSRFLDNTRSMFFIDHAGVLSSCIKGTSRDSEWRKLLLAFEKIDSSSPSLTWYARVPSQSNPSDSPSRGSSDFPTFGSVTCDEASCPIVKCSLRAVVSEVGVKGVVP
ncbi:bath-40 [Symbiodinium necroappetens]|uniref:Bath-40 protein n=1 Tax=Symbiodinium necroappetens TaxID=1628268 RepID=A0A812VA80_9DINO|nr:bath-40 [Symbiodinium necroappetens]